MRIEVIGDGSSTPMKGSQTMAWLVIQSSANGDDDGEWVDMQSEDVPSWVKEEGCISKMMEGKMVCADPEKKTRWYGAIECQAPVNH